MLSTVHIDVMSDGGSGHLFRPDLGQCAIAEFKINSLSFVHEYLKTCCKLVISVAAVSLDRTKK